MRVCVCSGGWGIGVEFVNIYYNSVRSSVCVSVCSRTSPRPIDWCTSFLVKRCFSYPGYTLSIFRDLELNDKVTMAVKVTKSSTKKINFGLHTRVIAQNDRLTELNNYYIKTYGLQWIFPTQIAYLVPNGTIKCRFWTFTHPYHKKRAFSVKRAL